MLIVSIAIQGDYRRKVLQLQPADGFCAQIFVCDYLTGRDMLTQQCRCSADCGKKPRRVA